MPAELCGRCRVQPRIRGLVLCPWCGHGPKPHLWPIHIRRAVEEQGIVVPTGQMPPSDVLANSNERAFEAMHDPISGFAHSARLRGSDQHHLAQLHDKALAQRIAKPGPWEIP
jgi:hypothetical protein